MQAWIKKIHMYLGLLNFVTLTVFGFAGLNATLQTGRGDLPPVAGTRYVPFAPAPDANDKQVADAMFEAVKIPLSNPVPKQAIRRDEENQIVLTFYTLNGPS